METKSEGNGSNTSHTTEDAFECPSCNIKIRISEVASHCEMEMDRMRHMQTEAASKIAQDVQNNLTLAQQQRTPYSVFQRVRRNRQTRLKRSRKRATPPAYTEHTCPICNVAFPQKEIQRHAERCLRKSNGDLNGGEGHSSNEDDDAEEGFSEEFEEYEWAGQKRIRVSSLLQGGYSSLGIGQSTTIRNGENDTDDEDLNVDEDDTQIYGPAQYNEADVIPTEDEDTSYMRSLITAGVQNTTQSNQVTSVNALLSNLTENKIEVTDLNCHPSSSSSTTSTSTEIAGSSSKNEHSTPSNYRQIIDSLKSRLRYYELHVPTKYKCLICLDDYKKPAISVSCWHVHCEDCWLRSLGARKLCPQCNLITTPKDLRRIYM